MNPAGTDETSRQERIHAWQTNTHPSGAPFPGDPRRVEEQRTARAELTPLGRKLLGVDLWA